ncbi:MAG: prephenate dehydratase [Candidatus Omnitrophica bacterium]|nr:prephenate dehydratase [Candidatus Omnitrophota bacterium]
MKKNLTELRRKIDRIDASIARLLNDRGTASSAIGEIKRIKKLPLYAPDRESQIYRKIFDGNKSLFSDESVKAIYREIMSACLSLERPLTVAFLGPELTFTHQASMKKFGVSVNYLSCDSIHDVFCEVEKGNADYGVVPVENSIEGAVNHTMDMFVESPVLICSEVYFRVRHALLSRSVSGKSIKSVYSKSEVFGQCRLWIEKNMPPVRLKDFPSTVKAAEAAARHKDAACIASELAAKQYDLNVLARSIEDSSRNVTRFLVIGKNSAAPSGKDKTSIVFSVKDSPGILHDMLSSFKKRRINLTKIESRPSKLQTWKYYFFVDMEGHCESLKVKRALKELEGKCTFIKILGSYPKG